MNEQLTLENTPQPVPQPQEAQPEAVGVLIENADHYRIILPDSKDVLKFTKSVSTELYYKMKRDVQTVSFNASVAQRKTKDKDVQAALKMPLDVDYFPDVCLDARSSTGAMREVTMKYFYSLSLADARKVEEVCEQVLALKV